MKYILIIALFSLTLFLSCSKEVKQDVEVYFNDFETNDLNGITLGRIEDYNKSKVLGRYNSGGFDLQIKDLPKHKLVVISFDLYIHDSWEGKGIDNIDGPDIWKMIVDDNLYINTTFSNAPCNDSNFCPPQSYPFDYPNSSQNPKWGSVSRNLPGACLSAGVIGGTTLYKITKTIEHSKATLLLQCRDQLIQNNTQDNNCDESWSVDNIRVKVINL
ncbi:hypothetical protein IWX76_003228 [Pedobacter sp. CAN_A7]|uniref:hypothetical protein n=1 Tax=Pedobacter sp. CAN_A7 TaxID=2787722 RepID=UPI0018CAA4E1